MCGSIFWASFICLSSLGCGSSVYLVTAGSHAPSDTFASARQPDRFIVWANDAGVEHYITGLLLKMRYQVVERDRLQKLFQEQGLIISMADSPEKLAVAILKASRLVGATHVIFAQVQAQAITGGMLVSPSKVSVRSVSVETGEVRWSGSAQYPQLVTRTNDNALAYWAILRATCRVEDGMIWEEPAVPDAKGCRKP